jgi:RHS repeat-associated protein
VEETEFIGPIIDPYPAYLSGDPIDLSSGAYLYDHGDLSVGSGAFPVSLSFSRSYNSNNLYQSGPLGPGWTHSFAINAVANSDGLKGMGQDSPIDGAAAIAAAYVIQDLFSDSTKPFDKVVVASLAQKWLMDRLITNTVNVTMGSQAEQFTLLADGSYNPRLGSSSRLSLNAGLYALQYKDRTTLNFDTNGNISTWKVPSGLTTSFTYDTSTTPLLTSVSNGLGRTLTLFYNGSQQLTTVSDNTAPLRTVGYTYNSAGNLASATDPLGNTTTFAYTPTGGGFPPGLLSQIFYPSNPGSPFVTTAYDSLGRVTAQSNANGSAWNYFLAGYRSEEDDPYGTQHVLYYNPRGKVLFDIQDYAGLGLLTSFVYDGLDRPTSTTLPEGSSTAYTYDATVNPWANNVASIVRNPKPGSPLSPSTTSYLYDPTFNKPIKVTGPPTTANPTGLVTTATYDFSTGNPSSVTIDVGAAPHFNAQTRYTYNALGLVVSMIDPMFVATKYDYDGTGNRLSTVSDAGPGKLNLTTSYTYNSRGDVTSVTNPNGNVTRNIYDDARRLATTTSPATTAAPNGVVTTNSYDADGRLLQVQQAATGSILRTTSSTYTPSGKVATTTDANSNIMHYRYDLLERIASVTDAEGRTSSYGYDAASRPTRVFNLAIQAAPLVQQAYTSDGRVASVTDANSNTTNFTYDGFDRLVTTTYPGSSTETFTYDAADNALTRKTRANGTFTFAYDTLNRPITKTPPTGPIVTYTYDRASRPTGVSDTSSAIAAAVSPTGSTVAYATTYAYDALNRPTGASWDPAPTATNPAAGALVTFGHSYNKVNQRIGQTADDSTWLSYPTGAPSSTSYTANNLNQYTAVTGLTLAYDSNGNLTGDGTYTLGYDPENRLTSASGAGNSSTYAFDAWGRRKSRTINGTTTISVTDADDREVLEYDGSTGALQRWYAYALGPNDVLSQMNIAAATRAILIPDVLGSIVATFDSSGALTKSAYQPYGSSAAAANPFGYTGQRVDVETGGNYYYRARHYSPLLGRFLQADPAGYAAGVNLYAYVGNDPLNAVDPTGLAADIPNSGGGPSSSGGGGGSPDTWSAPPTQNSFVPTGDVSPVVTGGSGTIQPVSPTQGPSGPQLTPVVDQNPGPKRNLEDRLPPLGGGGGGPLPTPNFQPPTNPPSQPPTIAPNWTTVPLRYTVLPVRRRFVEE